MAFLYEYYENSYIPINVNKETFDDIAEDILTLYGCESLLEFDMPISMEKFANDILGLNIIENKNISQTSKSMAIIVLLDGEVDVYENNCEDNIAYNVKNGTLLINHGNINDKNILIAQGCVHWCIHHTYFEEMRKVDPYSVVGLKYTPDYDKLDSEKLNGRNEAENMSAQGLGVALSLLMPKKPFIKKAKELFSLYDIKHSENSRTQIFRKIASELSNIFDVGVTSVLHRLSLLGFLTADDISSLVYKPNSTLTGKQKKDFPKLIKSSPSSFTRHISINEAFSEFQINKSFRDLLENYSFIYVDGMFVINNAEFVIRDKNDKLHLSRYAKDNPDKSSLLFTYKIQVDDNTGVLPQYTELTGDIQKVLSNSRFMASSGFNYKKLPHYIPNKSNNSILSDTDVKVALENVKVEFENYYNEQVSIATATDFWSRVEQIKKAKGISDNRFLKLTHLDDKTISRTGGNIPKGKNPPKNLKGITIRVAVAVCVGLNLDIKQAEELLALAKLALNNERECMAYRYILTAFKDCIMDERNDVLEEIGIDMLGIK